MTGNEYQALAVKTLVKDHDITLTKEEYMLLWNTIGITGEAGEFADYIKKVVFHKHKFDRNKVIAELGDIMWYIAAFCEGAGITMDQVMRFNIDKLKERYPEGFDYDRTKYKKGKAKD